MVSLLPTDPPKQTSKGKWKLNSEGKLEMQGEKLIKGIGKHVIKYKQTLTVYNNTFNNNNKNSFEDYDTRLH